MGREDAAREDAGRQMPQDPREDPSRFAAVPQKTAREGAAREDAAREGAGRQTPRDPREDPRSQQRPACGTLLGAVRFDAVQQKTAQGAGRRMPLPMYGFA